VQLQPLLGLGVSSLLLNAHPGDGGGSGAGAGAAAAAAAAGQAAPAGFKGPTGANTVRTLLNQYVPLGRFTRLAAMAAALLEACVRDEDYTTAAALLQVAHFFYTDPTRSDSAAASLVRSNRGGGGGGGAWSERRQFLAAELSGERMWEVSQFWDAYVVQAIAVEEQQMRLVHLATAGKSSAAHTPASAAAAATITAAQMQSMLQSMLAPMLQLGVDPSDVNNFLSRACNKHRVPIEDERTLRSLLEHLADAEESSQSGSGVAEPHRTLLNYGPFLSGRTVPIATVASLAAGGGGVSGADRSNSNRDRPAPTRQQIAAQSDAAAANRPTPPATAGSVASAAQVPASPAAGVSAAASAGGKAGDNIMKSPSRADRDREKEKEREREAKEAAAAAAAAASAAAAAAEPAPAPAPTAAAAAVSPAPAQQRRASDSREQPAQPAAAAAGAGAPPATPPQQVQGSQQYPPPGGGGGLPLPSGPPARPHPWVDLPQVRILAIAHEPVSS
jgi:hypothetical protein